MDETDATAAFPEVREIDDASLRQAVIDIWLEALHESEFDSFAEIPRSTVTVPGETDDRIERLVPHVRDVTVAALALYDVMVERLPGLDADRDLIAAGALLHDVTKLYEYHHGTVDDFGDWLGHPYYAVHLFAAADLPLELHHVVLAHTPNTAVEPHTFEAKLVQIADIVAVNAIFWAGANELHPTM